MSLSQHYKWILMFLFVSGNSRMKYNEPVIGKTRLVKELFLLRETQKLKEIYTFEPDKYGPCSNEIIFDLDILIKEGMIQEHPHPYGTQYSLTSKGCEEAKKFTDDKIKSKIENIKKNYNDVPLNELLVYVYSSFPKYTIKSLIRNTLN